MVLAPEKHTLIFQLEGGDTSEYIGIHWNTSEYIGIYQVTSGYIRIHRYTSGYIGIWIWIYKNGNTPVPQWNRTFTGWTGGLYCGVTGEVFKGKKYVFNLIIFGLKPLSLGKDSFEKEKKIPP